jgi:CRISPR-associated exonuclease Cas4
MDKEGYFSARDIVDYAYCPRTIYFRYCIKAGKEKTPKMNKGQELHESFTDKSKRTKIVRKLPRLPKRYSVRLSSRKYHFNTMVDCIILDNSKAYPIEFKYSLKPKYLYNTHKYQLVAQAMAIEEELGKIVPYGYIKYVDGSTARVSITQKLKEKVANILLEMEDIIRFERLPKETSSKKRCNSCFYINLCRRL